MTNTATFPQFMASFVEEVFETCARHGLTSPSASLSGVWTRYDGGDRFLTVEVARRGALGVVLEVRACAFRGEPDLVERRDAEMLFRVAGTDSAVAAKLLDWLDDTLADATGLLRRYENLDM